MDKEPTFCGDRWQMTATRFFKKKDPSFRVGVNFARLRRQATAGFGLATNARFKICQETQGDTAAAAVRRSSSTPGG